ncbi:MAG TPA: iron-containing alcohol dehydrogenase, partial [Limnochordia bacterium]
MAFRTDSAGVAEAISAFEVDWPVRIKAGRGALDALPACLDRYGWRKPLIVIDPGLATAPFLARIHRLFDVSEGGSSGAERPRGDRPAIFTDVRPDADLAGVDALRRALSAAQPDVVVTIGGGSAIDTAKAALVAAAGAQLVPYAPPPTAPIPHVAVPTTAGTGSEVSPAAVVRDPAARR